MKILLYNIDHGGRVGKNLKTRWPVLLQVIKKIDADLVIILEAWTWRKKKEMQEFRKLAGYPYFFFSNSNTKHNIATISKFKTTNTQSIRKGFRHSVLKFKIKHKNKFLTLLAIHLDPRDEKRRLKEIKKIITMSRNNKYCLILGDLNSLSPQDNYKNTLKILKQKRIKKFGKNQLEHQVISNILQAGFIDLIKNRYKTKRLLHTVPTNDWKDKSHIIKLRIDYIFCSPSLVKFIKQIRVIKGSETNKASDHYPLLLEI